MDQYIATLPDGDRANAKKLSLLWLRLNTEKDCWVWTILFVPFSAVMAYVLVIETVRALVVGGLLGVTMVVVAYLLNRKVNQERYAELAKLRQQGSNAVILEQFGTLLWACAPGSGYSEPL